MNREESPSKYLEIKAGFLQRIIRRHQLWWEFDFRLWKVEKARNLLHRLRQHYILRNREDPEDVWRRGVYWQRSLSNKWNAREFALRHGCRVPDLYWKGRFPGNLDFPSLPGNFVLRPVMGHSRNGVYVFSGGRDLLRRRRISKKEVKGELLRQTLRWGLVPILAEEFVKTEEGEYSLPVEYSLHTFAGHVGMISVNRRTGKKERRTRHYTSRWEPFPPEKIDWSQPDDLLPPPRCLDEMLDAAGRLGSAYGTYVRIDLFASVEGCVFCEFSSTPRSGRGYTPFADDYLGGLWDLHCPESV